MSERIEWVRAPTNSARDADGNALSTIWGKIVDRRGDMVLIMNHCDGAWVREDSIISRYDVLEEVACLIVLGYLPIDFKFKDVTYNGH